jgi:hypothetical protein
MISLILSAYVIIMGILSPCPLLVDHWIGSFITVLCWFILSFIYLRVRCIVATKLEKHGSMIFLVLGLVSLIGQVIESY